MLNRISIILISFCIFSCASFIEEAEIEQLKSYQEKNYILKNDIKSGMYSLKRAKNIKLYIVTTDEYIKVVFIMYPR